MIAEAIVPEFDHEMATTRKHIERVPVDKKDWLPHEKSMPMGRLAVHLAELPGWGSTTMKETELDMNPPGGPAFTPTPFTTTTAALALFDENVKAARAALAAASDADYMVGWTLKAGGQVLFTLPRIAVVRTWVINHIIHHRGQLSVYLRLNGVPVPGTYGPSADEPGM